MNRSEVPNSCEPHSWDGQMNPEKRRKEKQVLTKQPARLLTLHTGRSPSSLQNRCGWPVVHGEGVLFQSVKALGSPC